MWEVVSSETIPMKGNSEKVKLIRSSKSRGSSELELRPGSSKMTRMRMQHNMENNMMQ